MRCRFGVYLRIGGGQIILNKWRYPMQNHESFNSESAPEADIANEGYEYPSFEEHMRELNARENDEIAPEEKMQNYQLDETYERNNKMESRLANNPYSPYLSYESNLKKNNERFGESFAKLNENIYEKYDQASNEASKSSYNYMTTQYFFNTFGIDKVNNTRHYYLHIGDGKIRDIVTPSKIFMSDGKITNRDEFEPESLEIYEKMRAKNTEFAIKSEMDKEKEMKSLIQLNILNNGFANQGAEFATISTRYDSDDTPRYQIKDKLSIDGDEAVIPPNPNGELSLAEYIDSVAENYNDMVNEARANFEEFQNKFEKVSNDYFHSKNPVKSLWAGHKYHKMLTQRNSHLKELRTLNLYRSAANNLQQQLEDQN